MAKRRLRNRVQLAISEALEPRRLMSDPNGPSSGFVPPAMPQTSSNTTQVVKVLVLNYDPIDPVRQNQTIHQIFGWTDPRALAAGYEGGMEYAAGGAIDFQIVQWRDLQEFPMQADGFRYSPEQYVQYWQTQTGQHNTPTDFYRLAKEQGLAQLVNSQAIDEVWTFAPPGIDTFGESWMFGPGSFFINGPSFPSIGIDRAIAGYGFNYERGVAEMIHDNGHRTENHMVRSFGGTWNGTNPTTAWEKFAAVAQNTSNHIGGVGNTHYPVNGTSDYDYGNPNAVASTANDWLNYPDLTGATTQIDRSAWSAGTNPDYQKDYLEWFFGHLPRNTGTTADGRQNNWYKYIYDFNSYEPTTGLPRHESAIAGAGSVDAEGATSYTFTVRYYDQTGIDTTTLDDNDILVAGPGGFTQIATLASIGSAEQTTAGTARTVTYRITPPGGSWDLGDAGTYTLSMRSTQVRDTLGNFVPAGTLNTFGVGIANPRALDVNGMIASGQANVTGTTPDIGTFANLFDGNLTSLYRTPNIDPAIVQLSFTSPQTLYGFSTYFTGAFGDPAYQWTIETANTQADLDNHTGSCQQSVGLTGTPSDQYSTVNLGSPVTAKFVKLWATRLTGDDYVHIVEWNLIGPPVSDTNAPTAALQSAPAITQPSGDSQFISVTYSDNRALDIATLNSGDIRVTGPGGFDQPATFFSLDSYTPGSPRTVTYYLLPRGGAWDYTDGGTYTIALQPNQVADTFGNLIPSQTLGTFIVHITPPARRPQIDMTENNAANWTSAAQSGTASTSNDTAQKLVGGSSVKFVTDGGFDTYLRFPQAGAADWDIAAATQLNFSVYAQNSSSIGFQSESPMIRVTDGNGNYYEYRYYQNGGEYPLLNDARGIWRTYAVPLNAPANPNNGWGRTNSGTVDLTHIASVEFHADTWDAGFTLWYDGVGFNLPTPTGNVTLTGTSGPDDYFVRQQGNGDAEIFENVPSSGSPNYRIPAAQLASLTFNAGNVDDTVNLLTEVRTTLNLFSGIAIAQANQRLDGLSIGGSGKLDLADHRLLLDFTGSSPLGSWNGSAYTDVTGLVQSGRILSSSAVGSFTTVGVGLTSSTTLTVKFTYGGDATLDGKLNIDDYTHIDQGIAAHWTGWSNGDFNYDGKINIDDYVIIDSNIPAQGPPLSDSSGIAPAAAAVWMPRRLMPRDEDGESVTPGEVGL